MEFNLPKGNASIIKVIGVGGGGSNAVNHMYKQGIKGVDFLICNTDQQALDKSEIPDKLQLGGTLTEGMGAGSIPDVGKNAAIESADDIKKIFNPETKMVFITAGMGGGTGTGAAPVIAQVAREMGILSVGIVTMPFIFEGRKRKLQAEAGIEELRQSVDTLLIINNDKLRQMFGNLKMSEVFAQADNVLATAAKGIAEIITRTGHINVDFQDVFTVMNNSGVAVMGAATATGDNRSIKAVENALSSPLLNDNDIKGARFILLNMEYGTEEISMDEIAEITDFIQEEAGATADIIWGYGQNDEIGDGLAVTVIATGFELAGTSNVNTLAPNTGKKVLILEDDKPSPSPAPSPVAQSPVQEFPVIPEEPVLKTPDTQGRIEFTLDTKEETPAVEETKSDALEPFMRPVNKVPMEATPKFGEPKPFTPKPIAQTPPTTPPVEANETSITTNTIQPLNQTNFTPQDELNEGQQERVKSRMGKLKELSRRLRTSSGLSELEDVPAYQRRSVSLEDVPHSSESQVSKYSLDDASSEEGKKTHIGTNNSFLHDNVD